MIKYFLPDGHVDLSRATAGSSGYDIRANNTAEREILVGQRWKVGTGLHLEMPPGVEAQVRSRSGLAMNHGVVVLGTPCTIDSDYRGEVMVMLHNVGHTPYRIVPGERIAQLVFAPVIPRSIGFTHSGDDWEPVRVWSINELSPTARDKGGFGSTGR